MCYAYIKEQSAAREGNADQQATTGRGTDTVAAEPVVGRDRAEATSTSWKRFLDKMQRMLAARRREETTSV